MIDYVLVLNGQLSKLTSIENGNNFNVWQNATLNLLERAFGKSSSQWVQLSNITFRPGTNQKVISGPKRPRSYFDDTPSTRTIPAIPDNLNYCVNQSRALLDEFIEELKMLGPPPSKDLSNGHGISIVNNLNQNQSIQLSIVFNTLQEELTGRQFQEIEQILKSDSKPEDKKKTLLEKLASFGGDVASNVFASLLTNPQVYQAFM